MSHGAARGRALTFASAVALGLAAMLARLATGRGSAGEATLLDHR